MLSREIERVKVILSETNPLYREYKELVRTLDELIKCAQSESWYLADRERLLSGVCEEPIPEPITTGLVDPTVPVAFIEAEPVGTSEEEYECVRQEAYTKESVRGMLAEASHNGVMIQPIIEKFVPEGRPIKFSEIPQNKYPELVEELNNAR